jgi:hypothetical protein
MIKVTSSFVDMNIYLECVEITGDDDNFTQPITIDVIVLLLVDSYSCKESQIW